MKLYLSDVTLIAPTGNNIDKTIESIKRSCNKVDFKEVKLITHKKPDNLPDFIKFEESEYPMDSYLKYNKYVFEELYRHVNTEFALLVQYDSWIIHPECWMNEFLEYSYTGAPWPVVENSYIANNGERVNVGNGGFSLRSQLILQAPKKLGLELTQEQNQWNEDGNIACYWRSQMLNHGVKYAPIEVAARFSYESEVLENQHIKKFFGFHKNIRKDEYEFMVKEGII